MGWTKETNYIHGPSGSMYHSSEEANAIADCLGNQFTFQNLCDENCGWWMEAIEFNHCLTV